MSIREALPGLALPGAPEKGDSSTSQPQQETDSTSFPQSGGAPTTPAIPGQEHGAPAQGAGAAPNNFFKQEQTFDKKQMEQRQHIEATLGTTPVPQDDGSDATTGHTPGAVFTAAGVPRPPKAQLAKVKKNMANNPEFKQLVNYIHTEVKPKQGVVLDAKAAAAHIGSAAAKLAKSTTPTDMTSYMSGANAMAIVFVALGASMAEDNKNKQDILKLMQAYNQIGTLIQGYITTLQQAQSALDAKTSGLKADKAQNVTVPVQAWTNVDVNTLFQDKTTGQFVLSRDPNATSYQAKAGAATITADLSSAQGLQNIANNNTTQASNRYQSHDNDATQTFSMMATILKNMGDTMTSIVKNMN